VREVTHTAARVAWASTLDDRCLQAEEQARRLPAIRLHDLRHTNASPSLTAGVDIKVVSERLGHSQLAITADLYTHVSRGLGRAAANQIASVLTTPSREVSAASLLQTP
jgi:integrase